MKKIVFLLVLLLAACSKEIRSDAEADAAITDLTAEYKEALSTADKEKANKLNSQIRGVISAWMDQSSACSVLAFRRNAQRFALTALDMAQVLEQKASLPEAELTRALTLYHSMLNDTDADPDVFRRTLSYCRDSMQEQYSQADLAAIEKVFAPLHTIHRTVHASFPPAALQAVANDYDRDVAHGLALARARGAPAKEVDDCITAVEPVTKGQVSKAEVTAACQTMLR